MMIANQYNIYRNGFTRGYKIAQKLLAVKSQTTLDIEKHIHTLLMFKKFFKDFEDHCTEYTPQKTEDFMSLLDSRVQTLSLISRGQFINDFIIAFKKIESDLRNAYSQKPADYDLIYDYPNFEINIDGMQYSFEYTPPNSENGIDAIEQDCKSIDKGVDSISYFFGSDEINNVKGMEEELSKLMESIANQNNRFLTDSTLEILSKNKIIEKKYDNLKLYIYNIYNDIQGAGDENNQSVLDDLAELSYNVYDDVERMIDQYNEYADKISNISSSPRPSKVEEDNNSYEDRPQSNSSPKPSMTFEEKFQKLKNNPKNKSVIRLLSKPDVSHIVDRAIARLGK